MYEVFTQGGGAYLVDIFNAVAALSGGSAFANLIRVTVAFSLLWLMFQTAFGGSWMVNVKWYAAFLAIYLALFTPRVTLVKEDGDRLTLERDAPALRFIDHAWAATVHAFQGRTVDGIVGVMQSAHPHLTHQKAFYVEISRARHEAILVTDDRLRLAETLSEKTGERIAALEAAPDHAANIALGLDRDSVPPEPVQEHGKGMDEELNR